MMATEQIVPDMAEASWRATPAACHSCGAPWHAGQVGDCETSCLAPIVIVPEPLRWDGDDT